MQSDAFREIARADLPAVLLGCCIVAVAVVVGAAMLVRQKAQRENDALIGWFTAFAALYGARLAMQTTLLRDVWTSSASAALAWDHVSAVLTYAVPIPAMFFFARMGWIWGRRLWVAYAFVALEAVLMVWAAVAGFDRRALMINNIAALVAIVVLASGLWQVWKSFAQNEAVALAVGFGSFIVLALVNNAGHALGRSWPNIEPVGFVALLAALGFVTAQRTFAREERLAGIVKELEVARRIQQSILPSVLPRSERLHIAARYVPMASVAGDFYDVLQTSEDQVGVLVADVSGHGIPAALIASMVKLAAAAERDRAMHPELLLAGMNRSLVGNTQSQFVTAAYVSFDLKAGSARYSAAAHPALLLLRDGGCEAIEENGLMLAAFSFAEYQAREITLKDGDRLVLYTDGLLEAANAAGEEFGVERLQAAVRWSAGLDAESATERIMGEVAAWSADANDDRTLVVCDYRAR